MDYKATWIRVYLRGLRFCLAVRGHDSCSALLISFCSVQMLTGGVWSAIVSSMLNYKQDEL